MTLKDSVFFMGLFATICAVALASALVADRLPVPKEEPSCRWIATEVLPAAFEVRRGVRYERAAYEVDVLLCEGGTITVRK